MGRSDRGFAGEVLNEKAWTVLPAFDGHSDLLSRLQRGVVDAIRRCCGDAVADAVEVEGLALCHRHVPPDAARDVAGAFVADNRMWLIETIREFAVQRLGLEGDIVLHSSPTMRLVFPFSAACQGKIGLTEFLRGVKGPVQNPDPEATIAYHGGLPMSAWTHGPHVDSWWGQPFDGVNLWLAIAGINKDNGLFFFDRAGCASSMDHRFEPPYASQGIPLPLPTRPEMRDGDMLIFDPEILHATQVNVSAFTRISLAIRLNRLPLRFAPDAWRRHTGWISLMDGGPAGVSEIDLPEMPSKPRETLSQASEREEDIRSEHLREGEVYQAVVGGRAVLLTRRDGRCQAFVNECPHLARRLGDVPLDGAWITCADHGLRFSLDSGRAECGEFGLTRLQVAERDGIITVGTVED